MPGIRWTALRRLLIVGAALGVAEVLFLAMLESSWFQAQTGRTAVILLGGFLLWSWVIAIGGYCWVRTAAKMEAAAQGNEGPIPPARGTLGRRAILFLRSPIVLRIGFPCAVFLSVWDCARDNRPISATVDWGMHFLLAYFAPKALGVLLGLAVLTHLAQLVGVPLNDVVRRRGRSQR